jgi:outer membrane protein assembly factor BamB
MKPISNLLTVLAVIVSIAQSSAVAEDWPGWRGPRGDGTSLEASVPTKWSGSDNVAWKTPVPGRGHSSPIIWGNRIFLTTALTDTKDRMLLCLDRRTGKILWQETVIRAELEAKQPENSYASSTPVTDGERVYVAFLDGKEVAVAAYDFAGKQKWIVRPGRFDSQWGFSHSPILLDDRILIACCGRTSGFVAALNKLDGKTVWLHEPKRFVQAFSSPLVREMSSRMQMIVLANREITSYDPKDGRELWTADGPSTEFVATPVFHEKSGLLLYSSSWPVRFLVAIKPDGKGNVTQRNVVWQTQEGAPYIPSPIAVGDYVLTSSAKKELCCYEAASGKVLWKKKDIGLDHASPVAADGLVYFLNDDGVMNVVKAGPKFELVAKNELGEETYASPAISRGQIFLRSFSSLYCIGLGK